MDLTPSQRRYLIAATRTKNPQFKWRVLGERIGYAHPKTDAIVLKLEQLGLLWREENEMVKLTPLGRVMGDDLRRWYGPVIARHPRRWRRVATVAAAAAAALATGTGLLVAVVR